MLRLSAVDVVGLEVQMLIVVNVKGFVFLMLLFLISEENLVLF